MRRIRERGGSEVRKGKGSHVRVQCACGRWFTTVPHHRGEDVRLGTLRAIEECLAPCAAFGKGWLR